MGGSFGGEWIHVYVGLLTWNSHNIIYQLYTNRKYKVKKRVNGGILGGDEARGNEAAMMGGGGGSVTGKKAAALHRMDLLTRDSQCSEKFSEAVDN